MHHAVFGFGLLTQLRSQIMLGRRLVARGWRVTFLFCDESQKDNAARARKEIGALAPLVCLDEFSDEGEPRLNPFKTHPSPIRAWAAGIYCRCSKRVEFAQYHETHRRTIARSLDALTRLAPSALIYPEDGVAVNFRLLAVAKHLGIPIIDVPYAFSWRARFDLRIQEKHEAGKSFIATGNDRRALRVLAPQWLATVHLPGAVYFPPESILSLEAMCVSLEDPTTLMDGYVDVICVESDAMRQHYLDEGVRPSKMVMTGSMYCDEIVDSLALDDRARAAFRQPRFIDPDRPRVLITWSLDRHADRGRFNEFSTYKDMTLAFYRRLGELPGIEVTTSLSSLAPNCPPETKDWIESAGFSVTNEDIYSLIARHDLFVAASSSTRRWAFACGKPVVSYDTYGLEHDKMSGKGFLTSTRLDEVIAHIDRLTKSADAYRQLAAPQCAEAESWGVMDGHCTDRIVRTIEQAVESRTNRSVINKMLKVILPPASRG
jgi:glycosyltransferase involved in cell wall biosynthesis